ncbi:uncharacterized protein LOC110244530 [Exaiptasia diaphana]|uniref:QRICH1-like domain-containing protein n=1 Tax=Exaiptasia diaphana TaxID=2652724 RepID=A0A913XLR2_EXADI|nr:uncharacterized protein LOC110244530 [Exaiptasia diaphana]
MKLLLQKAVPISTRYKNSWAVNIFEEWRQIRENKVASLESTSLNLSLDSIQHLDIEPWETVTVSSLNFWLWKFVQEASDKKGSPYPARTLYQLIASLKRHLESKNRTDVNMLDKSNMSFSGLRKILDAEMKSVHSKGVTNRKKEKELITDEEEEAMWRKGVLGQSTAEILLKTPYKDGKFAYKNCVVGIHTLNEILPSLCLAIGSKRKTSHSLRVTCVSKLFNASVDEKLIRSRSGHVSDALLAYEKSSKEQEHKISNILNPPAQQKQVSFESKNEIKVIDISNDDIEMPVFDVNELESIFNDITGNEHEAQFDFTSGGPINISGNCNVTINQFKI